MIEKLKNLEEPTIYFTAAAIIFAGFLRLISFKYSNYVFTYCLFPYVISRGLYYFILVFKKEKPLSANERNRFYIYIAIFVTVLLSVLNFFSADFFVIFLIMVDYLMLRNEEKNNNNE
jgi:hypothetical protein